MKKNKLELTDKEYDALRALLYQTTTSAYAKAVDAPSLWLHIWKCFQKRLTH